MGLFQKWMHKIFMNVKIANPKAYPQQATRLHYPSEKIEWTQLRLVDFTTIFSIWFFCITFSITIFVIETIIYRNKTRQH